MRGVPQQQRWHPAGAAAAAAQAGAQHKPPGQQQQWHGDSSDSDFEAAPCQTDGSGRTRRPPVQQPQHPKQQRLPEAAGACRQELGQHVAAPAKSQAGAARAKLVVPAGIAFTAVTQPAAAVAAAATAPAAKDFMPHGGQAPFMSQNVQQDQAGGRQQQQQQQQQQLATDKPRLLGAARNARVQAQPLRVLAVQPPQQRQQSRQQHQAAGGGAKRKPPAVGQKRQHPPPGAAGSKKGRAAQKLPLAAQQQRRPLLSHGRRNGDCGSSSSSSDEEEAFIAGSLKQAPVAGAPQASTQVAGKGKSSGAAAAARPANAAGAAVAAGEGFGERVAVLRLDVTDASRWPGWQASVAGIRRVEPYKPSRPLFLPPPAASGAGAATTDQISRQQRQRHPPPQQALIIRTPSILSYDLSQLGGGFQALLLQLGDTMAGASKADASRGSTGSGCLAGSAPGMAGSSDWDNRSSPSSSSADSTGVPSPSSITGGSDRPGNTAPGLSWARLACLRLRQVVVPSGLVMVFACKAEVAPAVRLMASLGCKYVENLTWVQLGPDNRPLQRPSALFNRSHTTLLMGRLGDEKKSHLELRHQRTPDVIISPALPPGQCPDAVYTMLETLLPDAGSAAKSGGRARLLELNFQPHAGAASCSGRAGWATVVEAGDAA